MKRTKAPGGARTTQGVEVDTPLGTLRAVPTNDPDYPGIEIQLGAHTIALVEYTETDRSHPHKIVTRLWDKGCSNEPKVSRPFKDCDCCREEGADDVGDGD